MLEGNFMPLYYCGGRD